MTKKGSTSTENKGSIPRCVPSPSETETIKKNDEGDLVEKISDLKIGVTTRRASRLAEESKEKQNNQQSRVLTRQQMRMLRQQDSGLQLKEEDVLYLKKVNFRQVPAPVGMGNPCNMCYVNVILQSLSKISTFLDLTKELAKKDAWKLEDEDVTLGMNALVDIGRILEQGNLTTDKTRFQANVLSDIRVHRVVQSRDPENGIGGAGQQDAYEFLQLLFDCMQKLEKIRPSGKSKLATKKTLLNETVSGTTHMTRVCTVCLTTSTSEEYWNILSLPVSAACESLSDCFDNISEQQTLIDEDIVFCEKCKKKTSATVESKLLSATDMLVVHLKLSIPEKDGSRRLQRSIDIPTTNTLKMYSLTSKRSMKKAYELISAVMHQGSSKKSGHYTCYVRDQDKQWYFCNDDQVSQLQENKLPFLQLKTASISNPYILFFSKA